MTREGSIYKVTLVGGAVNVVLLLFKFLAGILGHSSAMVADAVHSLSDFATDIVVILFVHISGKPQDENHDYGHGKYETLATTIIGIALGAIGAGILYNGAVDILHWAQGEELPSPGVIALWAALASILLKEATYQYTFRAAKRLSSPAMEANAWHHRSDALSSIGTAIGIGGAILLGNRWNVLDPIAGVVVSLFILKVAYSLVSSAMGQFLERSLPKDLEDEIISIASSYSDVTDAHDLRTRYIGSTVSIELHIRMDGNISLTQAHDRATSIENDLRGRFGANTYVSIHVEPIFRPCQEQG